MTPEQFVASTKLCIAKQPHLFDDLETFTDALSDIPIDFQFLLRNFRTGWFGDILIVRPVKLGLPSGDTFLTCADDQSGGYYGFLADGKIDQQPIFYWYPSEANAPARSHDSIFELIADVGLSRILKLL